MISFEKRRITRKAGELFMAMGHDEVDEDTDPLQQKKREDGRNRTYPTGHPKSGLPVRISCVQCGTEIAAGSYCARCVKL